MADNSSHLETSPEVLLAQLAGAFRGEVYGIAFFTHLLEHYSGYTDEERQRHILTMLLQVEQVTAAIMAAHLPTLDVRCDMADPQMQYQGQQDADKWLSLSWPRLIDTMVDWVTPYQRQYREQNENAGGFWPLFYLVDKHETAIYEFLQAEQIGDENAPEILRRFLDAYPNSGVEDITGRYKAD